MESIDPIQSASLDHVVICRPEIHVYLLVGSGSTNISLGRFVRGPRFTSDGLTRSSIGIDTEHQHLFARPNGL